MNSACQLPTGLSKLIIQLISRLTNAIRLARLPKHRKRVKHSKEILQKLRKFRGEGSNARCLIYLRRLEPLLFEELVLSAFEDIGAIVLRNRRYTADGGIDGQVWFPKLGWYAIQCKRYSAHVARSDVKTFCDLIGKRRFSGGLFVHTGRTGRASYDTIRIGAVLLLSGDKLTQLILHRYFSHRFTTKPFRNSHQQTASNI